MGNPAIQRLLRQQLFQFDVGQRAVAAKPLHTASPIRPR
jgi:hypothetical protein